MTKHRPDRPAAEPTQPVHKPEADEGTPLELEPLSGPTEASADTPTPDEDGE